MVETSNAPEYEARALLIRAVYLCGRFCSAHSPPSFLDMNLPSLIYARARHGLRTMVTNGILLISCRSQWRSCTREPMNISGGTSGKTSLMGLP